LTKKPPALQSLQQLDKLRLVEQEKRKHEERPRKGCDGLKQLRGAVHVALTLVG
jgi:hypothetical protein